jgi:hypothetical protein
VFRLVMRCLRDHGVSKVSLWYITMSKIIIGEV